MKYTRILVPAIVKAIQCVDATSHIWDNVHVESRNDTLGFAVICFEDAFNCDFKCQIRISGDLVGIFYDTDSHRNTLAYFRLSRLNRDSFMLALGHSLFHLSMICNPQRCNDDDDDDDLPYLE